MQTVGIGYQLGIDNANLVHQRCCFGIASTKLGYLVYPQIKKLINGRGEKQNLTVMPTFEQHQLGYRISYKL